MLYELMPNMTEFLLLPLIERFAHMLSSTAPFRTNVRCPLRMRVMQDCGGNMRVNANASNWLTVL